MGKSWLQDAPVSPWLAARLITLSENSEEPAIVRATALDLLSIYGTEGQSALTRALEDPDPLVRAVAVSGLGQFPIEERSRLLVPLLRDRVRAVRLEAARVLAPASGSLQSSSEEDLLAETLAEYEEVQSSLADTAAAHLNLGVVHNATGNLDRAVGDYETALEREPGFLPASINLANLLNQLGQNTEAEQVLINAIARNPEEGELYYSLGLVQAEMNQLAGATVNLERAADLVAHPSQSPLQLRTGSSAVGSPFPGRDSVSGELPCGARGSIHRPGARHPLLSGCAMG